MARGCQLGPDRLDVDVGDVSDDVDLSFEILRESTGRNDTDGRDFCNDVLIFSAA